MVGAMSVTLGCKTRFFRLIRKTPGIQDASHIWSPVHFLRLSSRIFGGAPVTSTWVKECNADGFAENAIDAVKLVKSLQGK